MGFDDLTTICCGFCNRTTWVFFFCAIRCICRVFIAVAVVVVVVVVVGGGGGGDVVATSPTVLLVTYRDAVQVPVLLCP